MRPVPERNRTWLFRELNRAIGAATSVFAVWCQVLLLAAIPLLPVGFGADAIRDMPICRSDGGTQPAQPKPGHPAHDCASCVVCLSYAASMAILPPPPILPDRQFLAQLRRDAVRPRAPPVHLAIGALPRGPPSLI